MKILISAGHSTVPPKAPGATGNGYIEAIEALKLRDATADVLRGKGLTVVEDGEDGISDPLTKAIALAKGCQVAIEYHFNAGPTSATGIEVLCKPNKKALAQKIAGAIAKATNLKLRGDKGWKADDSGQHPRLGFCEAGGLIVEVGFISNASDMKAYKDNFKAIAANVAEALAAA
jgi:N-acetylmuramoyl-L-alanine amidase